MKQNDKKRITPEFVTELGNNEYFVFGSNMNGMHLGGAARIAMDKFGAEFGNPIGFQGSSYAIPTMFNTVDEIKPHVEKFIHDAKENKDKFFYVTKIGCGIAGFNIDEIAPLFEGCKELYNVALPLEFWNCY